jgi:adenine/guanine phosphoribosyltransferase-like PRPP-binding protein
MTSECIVQSPDQIAEAMEASIVRRGWLSGKFKEVAQMPYLESPGYIIARPFNLEMDPKVVDLTLNEIEFQLWKREIVQEGDDIPVYGVPVAGAGIGGMIARDLKLPYHNVARKSNGIPGAWENVMEVETHSYTTPDVKSVLHFGSIKEGMRVILADDVVATGETLMAVVKELRKRGVGVVAVVAMFAKAFEGGIAKLEDMGVEVLVPTVVESVGANGQLEMRNGQ